VNDRVAVEKLHGGHEAIVEASVSFDDGAARKRGW
jgi:hypothetical protein